MSGKLLYGLLIIEAMLCIAFSLVKTSFASVFSSIVAFPFEQIALMLKTLSLSGRIGNATALTLYALISLIPIWFLLRAKERRKLKLEDALLVLLSLQLFTILYLMINGNAMKSFFFMSILGTSDIAKALLGSSLWSVFIGYLVLRFLHLCFSSSSKKLQDYLSILLGLLAFLFIFVGFGVTFGETLASISNLKAANAGTEATLGMSYLFLWLQYMVNALPWLLNTLTIFLALKLLASMKVDRYSQETVLAADRLSKWCKKALIAVVISNIAFNILQLLFAKSLRNVNGNISLPIISICFVLAVLMFARIIEENRQLKSDNDLFI